MEQECIEQFHRARREEQRLAAAVRGLDPELPLERAGRKELLKYIGYRKRSAVQLLIRQGDLRGIQAMAEKGWIEAQYLPEYRKLAAEVREMEIWAYLYPLSGGPVRERNIPVRRGMPKEQGKKQEAGRNAGRAGQGDLCSRIWSLTLKKLRMKLPGFSGAFGALAFQEKEEIAYLAGDGFCIYYQKSELQKHFCREPNGIARDYMHLFLHSLCFHPVLSRGKNEKLWNLACDIAVEEMLDRWEIRELKKGGRDRRQFLLKEAGLPEHAAGPEKLYQALQQTGISRKHIENLEEAFRVDDHSCWREYRQEEAPGDQGEGKNGAGKSPAEKSLRFLRKWKELRKECAKELENSRQKPGTQAGGGLQRVRPRAGGGYDYRNFLENFMVCGEEVELDLDSFDYITYWYSRQHYRGILLMEPLEYKEIYKLREMVIAIDTSGSCSGRVVQQFLQETYHILSGRENFFRRMQVHLIQCDSMIQEHVVIRSEEEFLDYMEHVTVKGLGGTDFRPVFELVDELIRKKEILDLRGLLYFTDGDGVFPVTKPAYDTAFVFLNDAYEKHSIPDWGIRLNLGMKFWEE